MKQTDNVAISDVVVDLSIYPRSKPNTGMIEQYLDAMRAGDVFPPIVLEADTKRLIDGLHRLKAVEQLSKEDAKHDGKIPVQFVTVPEDVPAKLFAASFSVRHGIGITTADRKATARETIEANPEFNTVTLAKYLGVSDETARSYVGDILAKRREERASKAYRLSRLGWTQKAIAEALGVTTETLRVDSQNFQDIGKSAISQLTSGLPHDEVALRHGVPLNLVHAIEMEEWEDDAKRLAAVNVSIRPYDVWNFAGCHDLMGSEHPGRVPGDIVAHVLYFFTQQGDLVVDPMAGSGTTLDACLLMGRLCFGYDIDNRHDRIDIIPHDLAKDGWPDAAKKASLVFWDPPYFEKMDSSNVKDGYVDGSVSALPRDKYLTFFADRLTDLHVLVKKGCWLAFLMSDWDDDTGKQDGVFLWDYADLIRKAGWRLKRHIQAPLPSQQLHGDIINKFRQSRRLARLERYLLMAQK